MLHENCGFGTKAIHAGNVKDSQYGALTTPIFQTSTFVFDSCEQGGRRFAGAESGYIYTRLGNPTTSVLEAKIAALENGEACVAAASGMGAISSALWSVAAAGKHIVADGTLYGCTFALLNHGMTRYGVEVSFVDTSNLEEVRKALRPNTCAVYLETPANPNLKIADITAVAEIAHGYGAYLMVDMAHIAGLVAGGMHQSPVPYADVVTTTTHKTLRGPRGGLILTNNAVLAKRINSAVFPGTQGGPLEHVIAAKAVCFGEALKPEFKDYARKIVENAQAMAAELQARGVKLVSGGTDNHLMLLDLRDEECTGKELEARLDSVHITANKNTVPGETRSPFVTSGVRLGTPAVTTRGMGEAEMKVIADCIADCIWHYDEKKDDISARVLALTKAFPLYE